MHIELLCDRNKDCRIAGYITQFWKNQKTIYSDIDAPDAWPRCKINKRNKRHDAEIWGKKSKR